MKNLESTDGQKREKNVSKILLYFFVASWSQ